MKTKELLKFNEGAMDSWPKYQYKLKNGTTFIGIAEDDDSVIEVAGDMRNLKSVKNMKTKKVVWKS